MLKAYTTGIQHIGIPTDDLSATIRFYEGLGFEQAYTTVNGDEKVAFLQLHNLMVEVYENRQALHRPGAVDHIAVDVTDLEAAYRAVVQAGYAIAEEIQQLPFWERGVRFFKINGVNGESIEFCQRL